MWQTIDNKLYGKFEFQDFKQAFGFLEKVAAEAEAMDHHPTIHNTYNVVELWLSTHTAGDVVTDKDRELADKIDKMYDNKADK